MNNITLRKNLVKSKGKFFTKIPRLKLIIGQTISHYPAVRDPARQNKIIEKLAPASGQAGEGGMPSLMKNHNKLTPSPGPSFSEKYNKLVPPDGRRRI